MIIWMESDYRIIRTLVKGTSFPHGSILYHHYILSFSIEFPIETMMLMLHESSYMVTTEGQTSMPACDFETTRGTFICIKP
jgi:hypothetical protein